MLAEVLPWAHYNVLANLIFWCPHSSKFTQPSDLRTKHINQVLRVITIENYIWRWMIPIYFQATAIQSSNKDSFYILATHCKTVGKDSPLPTIFKDPRSFCWLFPLVFWLFLTIIFLHRSLCLWERRTTAFQAFVLTVLHCPELFAWCPLQSHHPLLLGEGKEHLPNKQDWTNH